MSTLHYVALCFLSLACGVCNASSDAIARLHDNQTIDNIGEVGISLSVALPSQAQWVAFNCDVAGTFQLPLIGNHQWIVPIDMQVDSCNATWGQSSASFSAYVANYDAGHVAVFGLMKLYGFYHSRDKFSLEKRAGWQN